ncbi:hypothetical protein PUN28_017995 [Cardiocondyla obscurior]|uniref:Uncharacterized protein n=1 Tax=Cardiocondyla obscurior TaxID=286306 RepID=A0AAW2EJ91_9HYME
MYLKLKTWSKKIIIGWIMNNFIINFYESFWWLKVEKTTTWRLYLPYILNHSLHINTLVDLIFTFVLWLKFFTKKNCGVKYTVQNFSYLKSKSTLKKKIC